jgi:hypothetical protein
MAKTEAIQNASGELGGYLVYCKACKTHHLFDKRWTFNGDFEKPTFSPSMLSYGNKDRGGSLPRCHSFVRNGKIEYLNDCEHEYKGQTLELEDIEGIDD